MPWAFYDGTVYYGDPHPTDGAIALPSPPPGVTHAVLDESGAFVEWGSPVIPINATQFLIDIQKNAAWKAWVNSLPQYDALSLTGAALRENWTVLQVAFDAAILEVMPSNAGRSEWQTIANNNGIPVTFEAS